MALCAGDIRLIKQFGRVPNNNLPELLGMTAEEVEIAAQSIGIRQRPFTTWERITLEDYWSSHSIGATASAVGRTPEECMAEAQRIRLPLGEIEKAANHKPRYVRCTYYSKPRKWTADEDAKLRKWRAQGLSRPACGLRLGVSAGSAVGRCARIGL